MNRSILNRTVQKWNSRPKETYIKRFFSYIDKNGLQKKHMKTRCWSWTGCVKRCGYSEFRVITQQKSHRVSWVIHNGRIPKGLHVLHHCDNPICTNPDHLFLGNQAVNNADMWNKGRGVIPDHNGEKHGLSKLTNNQVTEIRRNINNLSQSALGRIYGVGQTAISKIILRKTWKHI